MANQEGKDIQTNSASNENQERLNEIQSEQNAQQDELVEQQKGSDSDQDRGGAPSVKQENPTSEENDNEDIGIDESGKTGIPSSDPSED